MSNETHDKSENIFRSRPCFEDYSRWVRESRRRRQSPQRASQTIQLGLPRDPVHEQDGNLADSQTQLPHAKGDFNLERVAVGGNAIEIEPLQERTPKTSIVACRVPHRHARDNMGVKVPQLREKPPPERPIARVPLHNVPGPDHEIRFCGGFDETRDLARIVGKIGVQLQDKIVVPFQGEAGKGKSVKRGS